MKTIPVVGTGNLFAPAVRVNEALTASIEKRALQWCARNAPRWLSSEDRKSVV